MRMLPDGLIRPAERIEGVVGIADGLGPGESYLLGSLWQGSDVLHPGPAHGIVPARVWYRGKFRSQN